jgi:hypothetical protein
MYLSLALFRSEFSSRMRLGRSFRREIFLCTDRRFDRIGPERVISFASSFSAENTGF